MGPATSSWPHTETDPQRQALLAAADRLLTNTSRRSTGRLSVVQLAVEADAKYWVVAQKHTDLRDHFQRLATEVKANTSIPQTPDPHETLKRERDELREQCTKLEQLVALYATTINELALENQGLREHANGPDRTVTPLSSNRTATNRTEEQPGTTPKQISRVSRPR